MACPPEFPPGWAGSDRFTIDATTNTPTTRPMLLGPMMQSILEDRFQLKVHRETREVPIFELTVASGGPKLKPAKQACVEFDPSNPPHPAPGETQPPPCGFLTGGSGAVETTMTKADLCKQFTASTDR